MSEQILLLNPRRKRKTNRRYKYRRNRRAPRARRRNRRRGLPAGLRRYMASRRRNPRRYKYRRNRRRAAAAPRARRRNPRRFHHVRARRRNPRGFSMRGLGRGVVGGYLVPAVIGGVGGFGVDWVWGKVSGHLPASLQAGWVGAAVKSGVAIGLAILAGRFLPKYRQQFHVAGVGAVTIIAGKAITGAAMSAGVSGLSGYMDYQSYALPGMRLHGYMPSTLGSLEDLYSPAAVIQPSGSAVPRQFGGFSGYIAAQPHLGGGGGLMGYDWQHDGM